MKIQQSRRVERAVLLCTRFDPNVTAFSGAAELCRCHGEQGTRLDSDIVSRGERNASASQHPGQCSGGPDARQTAGVKEAGSGNRDAALIGGQAERTRVSRAVNRDASGADPDIALRKKTARLERVVNVGE